MGLAESVMSRCGRVPTAPYGAIAVAVSTRTVIVSSNSYLYVTEDHMTCRVDEW